MKSETLVLSASPCLWQKIVCGEFVDSIHESPREGFKLLGLLGIDDVI